MLKNKFHYILLSSSLAISAISKADDIELSPNLYFFNYEEFNTLGESLDKEQGVLPGVKLNYKKIVGDVKLSTFIAYNGGEVDYIGTTQTGTPHNTTTKEKLLSIGVSFTVVQDSTNLPSLFFGIRGTQWDRDILTRNNVRGLHEIYQWYELSAGFSFDSIIVNDSYYTAKFALFKILQPSIKVFLDNSSETLDLGEEPGLRFSLSKTWVHLNNPLKLSIITEYWKFGRSNSVFTNDFFGSSVFITEPDSTSFHSAIELSYSFDF